MGQRSLTGIKEGVWSALGRLHLSAACVPMERLPEEKMVATSVPQLKAVDASVCTLQKSIPSPHLSVLAFC